ncbi:MAG: GHKL domain-containing protein, partial [Clostridia bacterium]|nr:GHKL domain-containing protein [Clostridia bacterium]
PAQTTKKDRKNHGIGLKNVKRTAEKYSGTLITTVENGIFTAEVSMLTEA